MRISCWNWDAIGTKQRINFPDLLDPRIQEQLHFLQKLKLKLAAWDHLKVDGNGDVAGTFQEEVHSGTNPKKKVVFHRIFVA